jgi:hypothetical protein
MSPHTTDYYSIANYLKTNSKAMVTQILDTLIKNAVSHSKNVATEIIDDILKEAVKTDNNSLRVLTSERESKMSRNRNHTICFNYATT